MTCSDNSTLGAFPLRLNYPDVTSNSQGMAQTSPIGFTTVSGAVSCFTSNVRPAKGFRGCRLPGFSGC